MQIFMSQHTKPLTIFLFVLMSSLRSIFSFNNRFAFSTYNSQESRKLYATLCNRNRINLRSVLHRMTATNVESTLSQIESEGRPDFLKERDSKYFEFQRLESSIYKWWEQSGFFEPVPYENGEEEPFVLPMPPPNVTGYLHMGHAIFIALQDIMARFHRMRGRPTLWLPGTDHAGIATQLLVERSLTNGETRSSLGRDAFLDRVWKWKEEKGGYITNQMRKLGASADWSRERFTLEPTMSAAVTEAFIRLHEKGLVYRGTYMVNWSPNLQTAVSDLEVDYSEEVGSLFLCRYYLDGSDSDEFIPVATTRPETILGDAALCVHPLDDRFKHFVGRQVRVPMTDRLIPVIADECVDREFGTGALKVTPAHDPVDYDLGKRHNLPLISVMNKDATINSLGGKYEGMDRFVCREEIWKDMLQAGLGIERKPHPTRVPRSQRGGEVIEPMVSEQWFVRTEGMARRAREAVATGEMKILPERFEKTWFNWLDNMHDWCISRQLWWGHRIPVFYVQRDGKEDGTYVVARDLAEAQRQVELAQPTGAVISLRQEEDVLDTWFSSGLWPFSTVGWPAAEDPSDPASDFNRFYPGSVLETGYDILFFWVARMAMMGLELTGRVPFHTIYLHGLVRDGQGRKMSKTTGNVIDPLETIGQLGCDSLRYALVSFSTPGQDVPLSMEKIETSRNFCNKLWNAGKYIENCLASLSAEERVELVRLGPHTAAEVAALPLPDRYIISRSNQLVNAVTAALESYDFGDAGRQISDFLWDEFADWYIEASKVRMRAGAGPGAQQNTRRVLLYVWENCLKLLHPYMPFLTESLWQLLPRPANGPASIMVAPWPLLSRGRGRPQGVAQADAAAGEPALPRDEQAEQQFASFQALVRAIRNARSEYNVDMGRKIAVILKIEKPGFRKAILEEAAVFCFVTRADEQALQILEEGADRPAENCVQLVIEDGIEAFLPQNSLVDRAKELQRLQKQVEKISKERDGLQLRMDSPGFRDRAPPQVVQQVSNSLKDFTEQVRVLQESIDALLK